MKEKGDQIDDRTLPETKGTHRIGKEHQATRDNQIHLLLTAMGQKEVPELLEEEEEEMGLVIPVEMKDQIEMRVKILKRKMVVVLLQLG